jgi:hypothetical protein
VLGRNICKIVYHISTNIITRFFSNLLSKGGWGGGGVALQFCAQS